MSMSQGLGARPVRLRSGFLSLFTSARLADALLRLQSAHSVIWRFATHALPEVTDVCVGPRDKLTHRSLQASLLASLRYTHTSLASQPG